MNNNRKAFLDLISVSEGTYGKGDNGYNILVGGGMFHSYADHPRRLIQINATLKSTAAGRYQLLSRYFDAYKKLLNLPDFSPDSQDAIAIQQIKERKALGDVDAGRIEDAIKKCRNIWASFPGAGYGQREVNANKLIATYVQAGGTMGV